MPVATKPAETPIAPTSPSQDTQERPAVSVQPVKPGLLGERRAIRVRAALDGLEAALDQWGIRKRDPACIFLFDERQQWLLGCPGHAVDDFVSTEELFAQVPVRWSAPSFKAGSTSIPYDQAMLAIVGTVGTYTDERDGSERSMFVLQDWDALHANHPGFKQSPLEEWLGVFVHEAFHIHQLAQPAVKALVTEWGTNPKLVKPDDLAKFYVEHAEYREAVKREYDLLRAAVAATDQSAASARKALRRWLKAYRVRMKQFAAPLEKAFPEGRANDVDGFAMFLEGGARYVEAGFLIAAPDSATSALGSEPDFGRFAQTKGKNPSELVGLSELGPRYFYALGMYLCFLLDRADPAWKDHAFDTSDLLIASIERAVR